MLPPLHEHHEVDVPALRRSPRRRRASITGTPANRRSSRDGGSLFTPVVDGSIARWDLRPKLTLSLALYRTLRQDVRVADPVNIGQFLRSGEQRAQGLELGLQGEVTPTASSPATSREPNGVST